MSDVEAQEHYDRFFEDVFLEMEEKVNFKYECHTKKKGMKGDSQLLKDTLMPVLDKGPEVTGVGRKFTISYII